MYTIIFIFQCEHDKIDPESHCDQYHTISYYYAIILHWGEGGGGGLFQEKNVTCDSPHAVVLSRIHIHVVIY